jgi:flagellar biosynthesis/type III secretory pathway M-ring protein FliF/YscJ
MGKLRTALAAGVAFGVGVVTLRRLRRRRRTPRQEAAEATKDALYEAGVAAEHAMAAAGHARVAGEKAIETAREELQESRAADVEIETKTLGRAASARPARAGSAGNPGSGRTGFPG